MFRLILLEYVFYATGKAACLASTNNLESCILRRYLCKSCGEHSNVAIFNSSLYHPHPPRSPPSLLRTALFIFLRVSSFLFSSFRGLSACVWRPRAAVRSGPGLSFSFSIELRASIQRFAGSLHTICPMQRCAALRLQPCVFNKVHVQGKRWVHRSSDLGLGDMECRYDRSRRMPKNEPTLAI